MSVDWWREILPAVNTMAPDAELTVDDVLADGDRVTVRLTVRGVHIGRFFYAAA